MTKIPSCGSSAESEPSGRQLFQGANCIFLRENKHGASPAVPRAAGITFSSSQVIIYEAAAALPPAKTSPGDAVGSSGEVIVLFRDILVFLKDEKAPQFTAHSSQLIFSSLVREVLMNDFAFACISPQF